MGDLSSGISQLLSVCLCNPTGNFYYDLLYLISCRNPAMLVLLPDSIPRAAWAVQVRESQQRDVDGTRVSARGLTLGGCTGDVLGLVFQRWTFPSLLNCIISSNCLKGKTKTIPAEREVAMGRLLNFISQDTKPVSRPAWEEIFNVF